MNYLLPRRLKKQDFQEYKIPVDPEQATATIPGIFPAKKID